MNYAPGILDYLAQSPDFTEVLLAPGATPLQRAPDGMKSIGDTVLNGQDVRDTLTTLMAHAAGVNASGKHGVFSFGMPQRGRFRVTFMTQRGSLVASIIKIPGEVPRVDQLVAADQAADVEKKFLTFRSGLLLVAGPSSMLTNVFVYALLRSMSEQAQRVIFILEAGITFLLRHGRSLVLQSELGSDVDSIEEGLRAALTLEPQVIYIRDLANARDLGLLAKAVETQVFAVATVSVLDAKVLLPVGREQLNLQNLRGIWNVDHAEDGRLRVLME